MHFLQKQTNLYNKLLDKTYKLYFNVVIIKFVLSLYKIVIYTFLIKKKQTSVLHQLGIGSSEYDESVQVINVSDGAPPQQHVLVVHWQAHLTAQVQVSLKLVQNVVRRLAHHFAL